MLSGEFQRKLRKLNPELRIWCKSDDSRPAGLFHVVDGEFTEICGIDKNWVPEHTVFNENGTYKKGGWRRVLRILIQRRLVDRFHAERVFGTHLEYASQKPKRPVKAPSTKMLEKYSPEPGRVSWTNLGS